jgi:hypothetical protein
MELTEDEDEATFSVWGPPKSRLFLDEFGWKVFCSFLNGFENPVERSGKTCDRIS